MIEKGKPIVAPSFGPTVIKDSVDTRRELKRHSRYAGKSLIDGGEEAFGFRLFSQKIQNMRHH